MHCCGVDSSYARFFGYDPAHAHTFKAMGMKRKKDPLAEEAWRALIHHIKNDPSRAGAIKRIFNEFDSDNSGEAGAGGSQGES